MTRCKNKVPFKALDFLMNVLKEHEQTLDESIHELATVAEQMGNTDALKTKVESAEQKIDNLQKEITESNRDFIKRPQRSIISHNCYPTSTPYSGNASDLSKRTFFDFALQPVGGISKLINAGANFDFQL